MSGERAEHSGKVALISGASRGLDEAAAIERHRRELDITRFGTPQDIAGLVRFIAAPRGRLIHGASLDIDGARSVPLRMSNYD